MTEKIILIKSTTIFSTEVFFFVKNDWEDNFRVNKMKEDNSMTHERKELFAFGCGQKELTLFVVYRHI